ncbi:pilus assembly protein PilM [bacterium]|nr:pilus assembly protein PilM [bacterium]MBU1026020.1 pilus assembly protein PilM [bacterium]
MALPFFKSAARKALGLHIGASQIRLVEIERTKTDLKLLNVGWIETPSEAYVGSHLENPSIVAGAITRLLASKNIRTKRALATIDANDTIARTIMLPSMAKKDLRKAIIFETEASLPSTGEENILDYQILRVFENPEDNTEQVAVLILSTQRQNAVAIAEALTQADLKPQAIDITPVASFRSEKRSDTYQDHGEDLILITINDKCTDLTIINKGSVRFVRSLPMGSANMLDVLGEKPLFHDIEDKLDKGRETVDKEPEPEDEPEEDVVKPFDPFGGTGPSLGGRSHLGTSHSFMDPGESSGLGRIDSIITELADETLNTMRYGQSIGSDQADIKYAILNGYFPYKEGFIESLKEKLGQDVYSGDPFSNMDLTSPGLDNDLIERFAPNFSTACGLALRGVGEYE